MKWAPGRGEVWMCMVNIVNHPAVDWPPLLRTLTDCLILVRMTTGVCPYMSRDFEPHLTSDLDIGVNTKFGGYIFYASRKSKFNLLLLSKKIVWDCLEVNLHKVKVADYFFSTLFT